MASGRFEHKVETEEKLRRKIEGKPEYVLGYYYSLSRREYKTKEQYIKHVLHYLGFLTEKGIDVKNTANLNLDNTNMFFDDAMYVATPNGERRQASVASMNNKWSALNSFFNYMIGSDRIAKNPMDHITRVRGKDNVKRVYMNEEQIKAVVDTIQGRIDRYDTLKWLAIRDMAIMTTFLQTGIRATALTEINMEDVEIKVKDDGTVDCIVLQITDKEHEHYTRMLVGKTAQYMLDWIDARREFLGDLECDALFVTKLKKRMSYSNVDGVVSAYTPTIDGKKLKAHKLRATYARTLYEATGDIYFVQKQMHHKSASVTSLYVGGEDNSEIRATDIMNSVIGG